MQYTYTERKRNSVYADERKPAPKEQRERRRLAHLSYGRGLSLYMRIVTNGERFA